MTRHAFCKVHGIGYNRDLDRMCPQCMLAHIPPWDNANFPTSLDFDVIAQKPVDASGALLDARTLLPLPVQP